MALLSHPAALMLLFITCRNIVPCITLNVDPPEDLKLLDLGHLGHLEITWSPPASLTNMTQCHRIYQLEYFNTYTNSWTAIRTSGRSYSAQFDLMQDVRVRVYTLLKGPCTNGTMLKSSRYTEVVQKPSCTGLKNTVVKDFVCVFYNMENMVCGWKRSHRLPNNSQQHLYFWHERMERAEECPKYITSPAGRIGCNLTEKLPDFTDINFCINGSAPAGKFTPSFFSLQIQNHVKPGKTEILSLQNTPDAQLELHWNPPPGKVPVHCLEWEVEHSQQGPDGEEKMNRIITDQTSLTLSVVQDSERNCARVRSKLHKYCVDKSFWSEWSRSQCQPAHELKEAASEYKWDVTHTIIFTAFVTVALLSLCLCAGTLPKLRDKRRRQIPLASSCP